MRFAAAHPEVAVGDVAAGAGKFDVEAGERVVFGQQCEHAVALGHGADDFRIADLAQEGLRGLGLADVCRDERRAPDLHDVMFARLGIAIKKHKLARGEEAEAVTRLRRGDALRDEIVAEQQIGSAFEMREDTQRVLAVCSRNAFFESHRRQSGVEAAHLAGLQHITVREQDAVVVRQQHAAFGDAVNAVRLPRALIEDEMTPRFFLIRQDFEHDEIADDGVVNLGVVERLVLVIDGFAEDAATAVGVVLDFDREIAANGLDEDAILNADVRMRAVDVPVPRGPFPLKLLRRGEDKLVIAAIAEVAQRAYVVIDEPFEGFDLRGPLSDLKAHVEMRADAVKLQEGGVLVVVVEVGEVLRELRLAEDAVLVRVEAVIAVLVVIHREDVLDFHRGPQPKVDVVAEEKTRRPDRGQIARHAVVVRRQSRRRQQRRLNATELGFAIRVEELEPALELRAMLRESLPNDFVSAGFELG